MKRTGRHPERALSPLAVSKAKTPGRYGDGNGLYLFVDKSGAKRWVLRVVVRGRRTDIGLGSVQLVPLADAREKARVYRRLAREGGDPLALKRQQAVIVPNFAEAAAKVHEAHQVSWKSGKHRDQWLTSLQTYAFPLIGQKRVDHIDISDVHRVLAPIWNGKAETARRLRQRIGIILDWAIASGHRTAENPVRNVVRGLPRHADKSKQDHFDALPWPELPAFILKLRKAPVKDRSRLGLELLILTGTRTAEILGATWEEFDFDRHLWTIPASRMKGGREHRVPLSSRAMEILSILQGSAPESNYVLPGRASNRPASQSTFQRVLQTVGVSATVHGFRSTFRDWASERTNFPTEVCEAALAHTVKSKVEAAYRRGDLLEKRQALMDTWAAFVTSAGGDVVQIRAGGRA